MAKLASSIVEICVFKIVRRQPRYLLLRRAANESIYPGLWQIVSGTVEGEEHAVHAALREMREETSLKPIRLWAVPYVDLIYTVATDTVNLSPLFAAQVGESDEPMLSDEHQSFGWDDYETARSKLVWPGQREGLNRVHEYIVGGLEGGRLREILDFVLYEERSA
jgi:8-oxo-dGTP pyrophosphatase MutT (NUDIX family)